MALRLAVFVVLLFFRNHVYGEEQRPLCEQLQEIEAKGEGEISSPLYGKGLYPEELSCEYRIYAPTGYRIKLTFKDLDIDPSDNCGTDKLAVYSGKERDTLLGIFCGHDIPHPVISQEEENEITLVFQSDYMVGGKGFLVQYESAPHLELCRDNEKMCRNRNCYRKEKKCDGVDDCGDGSDEENCGVTVALPSNDCGETPIKPSTIYSSHDRIVGGTAAIPNSWPWQVSLRRAYIEPNGHFCGGSLVSPQWVVTAGHCVASTTHPPDIRVSLGSHNKFKRTKFEQIRFAEKIITYPDLEGENLRKMDMRHDIALIRLNAPVSLNDGVQLACLPYLGWEMQEGLSCYATGWGETRGTGFSDELKQTEQIIQPKHNCTHDEQTQICVFKSFNSPCHGDSGGPLVCMLGGKWFVMGATSFGTEGNFMSGLCAMPHSRLVFSKVSDKGDWIRKIIEAHS